MGQSSSRSFGPESFGPDSFGPESWPRLPLRRARRGSRRRRVQPGSPRPTRARRGWRLRRAGHGSAARRACLETCLTRLRCGCRRRPGSTKTSHRPTTPIPPWRSRENLRRPAARRGGPGQTSLAGASPRRAFPHRNSLQHRSSLQHRGCSGGFPAPGLVPAAGLVPAPGLVPAAGLVPALGLVACRPWAWRTRVASSASGMFQPPRTLDDDPPAGIPAPPCGPAGPEPAGPEPAGPEPAGPEPDDAVAPAAAGRRVSCVAGGHAGRLSRSAAGQAG